MRSRPPLFAIGLAAALGAKRYSRVPVVFCQVFNVAANELASDQVKGVSSIPSLRAQIRVWKELDPTLERVGTIIGDGHNALVAEAIDAASAENIQFRHQVAGSDRETLYHFKRLVADIDGYLLFPDNRILSPAVMRQMFADASRHDVRVAVFNPSLLSLGATVSFSARDSDVASTVVSVVNRITRTEKETVPMMTSLSALDVKLNNSAADALDLSSVRSKNARVSVLR